MTQPLVPKAHLHTDVVGRLEMGSSLRNVRSGIVEGSIYSEVSMFYRKNIPYAVRFHHTEQWPCVPSRQQIKGNHQTHMNSIPHLPLEY